MKRRALITGGSRGIGAAIASRMRKEGHEVFTPTREELDLSSVESVKRYVFSLESDFDILVNNAGINPIMRLDEMRSESLMEVIQVDLVAPGAAHAILRTRNGRTRLRQDSKYLLYLGNGFEAGARGL